MLQRRCGFKHQHSRPSAHVLARFRRQPCISRALATEISSMFEHRAQVTLWITCASMAVGAYLPGLVALMLPSNGKRSSNLASTASAGLLLGAGLCVILPEGFHSLDEAQEALSESQRLPEWAAGASLLAGFMLMIAFDMLRPKHDEAHGHIHADQQPFQSLVPNTDAPPAQHSHQDQQQPGSSGTSSPCHHTTTHPVDNTQLTSQRSAASCHECCLPECTWKPDVCYAADTALIITDSAVPVEEVVLRSSHRLSAEHQADSRQHQGHAGHALVHRHVNGDGDEASRHKSRNGCGGSKACIAVPLLDHQHHDAEEGAAGGSEWNESLTAAAGVSAASVRAANQACVGLVLHSAADGLAVGAAALSSNLAVPITIALSIMAHKMPVGYGLAAFLRTNCRSWEAAHAGLLSFAAAAPLAALATYYVFGQTPWASQPQAVAIALLASGGTVLHAGAIHVLPTAGNRPIDLLIMFTCSLIPLVIGALIPVA